MSTKYIRAVVQNHDSPINFQDWIFGRFGGEKGGGGHEMGLELVCGADIWCNRHCAPSRVRIRAPRGPRTGPEPPNYYLTGLVFPPAFSHGLFLFGPCIKKSFAASMLATLRLKSRHGLPSPGPPGPGAPGVVPGSSTTCRGSRVRVGTAILHCAWVCSTNEVF